ncbi:hypothetical protein [Roseomonas sp. 18066]|uniref:hypothetical protein n=1 Tax=Roseomonas sp. 18066 TaxID=2681412 RepID=UPI0013595587|nr:hypothetical protein [Roseomonas sp. 18066]
MTADSITILQSYGPRLAKRVRTDGTIEGYDTARHYDFFAEPLADLPDLLALLGVLIGRPDCAIVRGAIADPSRRQHVRRLVHPDPETGEQPTLRDVARRWLALDLDGVPLPEGIDRADLIACARAVLPMLPQPLQQADLVVQATGSHGLKPGARLRLWGWCDRPLSGAEGQCWFRGLPVDASGFRAGQITYTAAPAFEAGVHDHLPCRLAWLQGERREILTPTVAALTPAPKPRAADESRAGGFARPGSGSAYALAALTRAVSNIRAQSEGTRHPTAVAEAWGLARLVRADLLTADEVSRAIGGALVDVGKSKEEGAAIVKWAVGQRMDTGNLSAGVRA